MMLIASCLFCVISCKKVSSEMRKDSSEKMAVGSVIKVACIGNSITYGSGIANRNKNAYPAQLQELLGAWYDVQNFGVSGRTLLKKGDFPYWETQEYKNALEFQPDIVYIKLGTNDSKAQNRVYLKELEANCEELIANFREKNSKVRVVLLLPVPSFSKESTAIWNPVIKNEIIPKLQNVAYNTETEVLDLYQLLIDKPDMFPDAIHPSSLGATIIAKRLYENVKHIKNVVANFVEKESMELLSKENFHGYELINFKLNSWGCKLVKPRREVAGSPWVLRARFWGHQPQTDIALLERGFHIAYIDVANLFGGNEGLERWNTLYAFMTRIGMSKKVVLEGMSRGGLILYNWAVENPEKVACVYADAPVLDGTSWPGGFGKSKKSLTDWEAFKKIYNLDSYAAIVRFSDNPIHKIKEIAAAGFPMLHVCGEADNVVPIDENTKLFEQEIKNNGGDISVIYKENIGHHPHSLENPTPIVDFILRATALKTNFAAIIAPGAEYRSGAGWVEGKGWWYQMQDIDSLCANSGKIDLLLLGNSITQGFGGTRTLTTYKPGNEAENAHFENLKWINAGISGDRTQHILWRVKNGHYNDGNPDFATLAIGVNNFWEDSAEEIAEGIILNIETIQKKLPNTILLFYGPLPVGIDKDSDARSTYNKVHELVSHLGAKEGVYYYNMLDDFTDEKGNLDNTYYSEDGIHLIPDGYEVWAKHIRTEIEKIKSNK